MKTLRVKNWLQFQHYGERRNPPWIKLHNEILHSRTWVSLDDASKALAVAIMLLASRFNNEIPADPEYIQRVAYLSTLPDLQKLVDCDFIEIFDKELKDKEDKDIDIEGASNVLAPASKRKSSFTPKTFQPEWITEAREKAKYARLDIEAEAEQFQLHHETKDSKFTDWKKAWWYWLNNAVKFHKGGKDKTDEQDARLRKLVEEQERMYS